MAKLLVALAPLLLLQGCFFFFIPGSAVQAISDTVTGAEGAHCVSERVKVGDTLKRADGATWTVKSLSGTASGCKDPAKPIRALLVVS